MNGPAAMNGPVAGQATEEQMQLALDYPAMDKASIEGVTPPQTASPAGAAGPEVPAVPAVPARPPISAVSSTLRIPLAARALGDALFPEMAAADAYAGRALEALGDDGQQWLSDRHSVYGVLARTRRFRELAADYLRGRPDGHIVNLGCGLSHYVQWLDNGQATMTDADLPEVLALRRALLPAPAERYSLKELDLTAANWWDGLGLPAARSGAPVFLFSEGVLMYLQPREVDAVLATFGERAPAGSLFAFDAICWLAAGRAKRHPSIRHTEAQFHWGPRKLADLLRPQPRLKLYAIHRIMEGYGLPYSLFAPVFRALTGVPFYALYVLSVS
ncbi:class I SAM-dependent methyltransferase [Pollutimonas bauzanensis]|uniref:O-Methyltransferase involved in polyketide biosynthesis n=1 Tax=Pollutimonas bauzanensis TaxID=658167 RepID=A0A1M5W2X0_9BURK|nr:class I SAM-dependent methyltransferase [Pollutimonas bauzanensis]SHH81866.1 O-Methyltransferase involved in polyketide biosynthesis [Pollutimonas bauzanensis]